MKISVCDICYHQKGELKGGRWRLSFKKSTPYPQRIALDACNDHKDWLKQFKTYEEADKAVGALYMTATPKPAVTEQVPGAAKGGKGYHIAGAGTGGKKSQGFLE